MPGKINNSLPEKDYAIWLGVGLALLVMGQSFSKQTGTLALVLRWLFLIAAAVNYGYVLYRYDRDRKAKKKAAESTPMAENQDGD